MFFHMHSHYINIYCFIFAFLALNSYITVVMKSMLVSFSLVWWAKFTSIALKAMFILFNWINMLLWNVFFQIVKIKKRLYTEGALTLLIISISGIISNSGYVLLICSTFSWCTLIMRCRVFCVPRDVNCNCFINGCLCIISMRISMFLFSSAKQ